MTEENNSSTAAFTTLTTTVWPNFKRFLRYSRDDVREMLYCGLCLVGIAATNTMIIRLLATPLNAIQSGMHDELVRSLIILAVLVVINQGFHFGATSLFGWLQLRFISRVRASLVERCLKVSFSLIDTFQQGDLLNRMGNELNSVASFTLNTLFMLVSHALIFSFYTAMLFWIDWRLASFALALSPIFYFHQKYFGKHKQRAAHGFFRAFSKLLSLEQEVLTNLRSTSSFGAERVIAARHSEALETARAAAMRTKWLDAAFQTTVMALIYLGAVVIVFIGVAEVDEQVLSVGELISFLLFLGYLSVPIRGTAQIFIQCQEDVVAARRVAQILDQEPSIVEPADAIELKPITGRIELDRVWFTYPGASQAVLKNLCLTIEPGQCVALVGPSGSGKSTLAKLLMRFYDPQSGAIMIDGTDIRHVTLASLRRQLAIVWQEPFLINDSLRANLALANPHATHEAMIEACRAARAWEFICELQQGLDTVIGTGGVDLSAGQRQRIAIAQAFLRDAPILILDEASSALDSAAEQQINLALDSLREGRTTLVIAHRFSAIRGADSVVFFNGDGSVTVGNHESLWASHPSYRAAVEWQTQLRS